MRPHRFDGRRSREERVSRLTRLESEKSKRVLNVDDGVDVQSHVFETMQALSQFNEGLLRNEPASTKFHWKNLFGGSANLSGKSNFGSNLIGNDGGSSSSDLGVNLEKGFHGTQILNYQESERIRPKTSFPQGLDSVDEDIVFRNPSHLYPDIRQLYKGEEKKPLFYSRDALSSSLIHNDGTRLPKPEFSCRGRMISEPHNHGIGQAVACRFSAKPYNPHKLWTQSQSKGGGRFIDRFSQLGVLGSTRDPTELSANYSYPDFGKHESADMCVRNVEPVNVPEDYYNLEEIDATVNPHINPVGDGRLWGCQPSLEEQTIPSYISEATDDEFVMEEYVNHENLQLGDGYGLLEDPHPSYEQSLNSLPMSSSEERAMYESSKRMLKRSRATIEKTRRSGSSHNKQKKATMTFREMERHRLSYAVDHQPPFLAQCKSARSGQRDIKSRLTFAAQDVKNPRLSIQNHKIDKRKRSKRSEDVHKREDVKANAEKTEPPEGSEEFKQLVRNAYFKFLKQMNENPAQRRKYTEEGKAGCLKCSICCSSKEYADSRSLATHAATSPRVGFRAQHLAFHKALCVLMGWNDLVSPNSRWVCNALPDDEALALKEDLIVWPPLVIIHNTSLENNDPDEWIIVSVEALDSRLKGMEFRGFKVSRGKAANQSIMVVNFSPTLSGLEEAERLHKFYVDIRHGRFDLLRSTHSISGDKQNLASEQVQHILYGYLGIAGDLDKLEFESKKRCSIRSRKQIQAIADAPLLP